MSSINLRSSGRRRRKPAHAYYASPSSNAEERLLQQAIANSRTDVHRPTGGNLEIPVGPTFFPTLEEFCGNPLHYIDKISPIAGKYGICKIVPPKGWNPPFCVKMNSKKTFQTKEQLLHRLQEGISFGDGEEYTASEYLKMAQEETKKWGNKNFPANDSENKGGLPEAGSKSITPEILEQKYWDTVETHADEHTVEYGNDVDTHEYGSGFPRSERGRYIGGEIDTDKVNLPEPKFGTDDFYKETYWNLNNIPCCPDSILRHIKVGVNGINVPWMYFGSLFATFCWHNEDNYLYSINYHHWGAPKQWYGVPGTKKDAEGLERVFRNHLSMKMRDVPDLLHHITTMFSPRLLLQGGVPVYKVLQHPGEFVVTFPRAFHGGFSMGPNIGEAVNFATHDWISHGADAIERYRSFSRPAVFSHDRLTFTMANHLKEQKAYRTCILLVKELHRVIGEEMRLRIKLFESGVRDVSKDINLPRNRIDQLDEESADYDDKRLCHACKHVCFFSCVACECSQSKVSCLRHSHYMCRCPTERKYMMIWSTEEEMKKILKSAELFAETLKAEEINKSHGQVKDVKNSEIMPPNPPGFFEDSENHKGYEINLSPSSPLLSLPESGKPVLQYFQKNRVSQDPPDLCRVPEAKKMKLEPVKSSPPSDVSTSNDSQNSGEMMCSVETNTSGENESIIYPIRTQSSNLPIDS